MISHSGWGQDKEKIIKKYQRNIWPPVKTHGADRLLSDDSILCDNSKQRVSIFKKPSIFTHKYMEDPECIFANSFMKNVFTFVEVFVAALF